MPFFPGLVRPSDEIRSRFVALVGCGKAKLFRPAQAKKFYTGSLTKKSIQWADRNCDTWFILSAKYGLLSPRTVIEPYDTKITDLTQAEQRAWGTKVVKALEELNLLWRPILILAGVSYYNALTFPDNVRAYMLFGQSMGMGDRLSWMNKHPTLNDSISRAIRISR